MAVLMLFNDAESLVYEEIEAATSIPEDDLKRVLQSLACVKVGGGGAAGRDTRRGGSAEAGAGASPALQPGPGQQGEEGGHRPARSHCFVSLAPRPCSHATSPRTPAPPPPPSHPRHLTHATSPPQGKAVLRKEPMSKDVRPGDRFSVNDAFTSKSYKVKIGMVTAQVGGEGRAAGGSTGQGCGDCGDGGGVDWAGPRCAAFRTGLQVPGCGVPSQSLRLAQAARLPTTPPLSHAISNMPPPHTHTTTTPSVTRSLKHAPPQHTHHHHPPRSARTRRRRRRRGRKWRRTASRRWRRPSCAS